MYVFVYGTLMRGFSNPVAVFLRKNADFIGKGSAKGELFDLGNFPGAVFDENSNSLIHGELYFLKSNKECISSYLDDYEGVDDPDFDFYEKRKVFITVNTNKIEAMVYHLKKATHTFKKIVSGDYSKCRNMG